MRMWPFFTSMALIWFVSYSKTDIDDLHGGVLPFFFCWGGGWAAGRRRTKTRDFFWVEFSWLMFPLFFLRFSFPWSCWPSFIFVSSVGPVKSDSSYVGSFDSILIQQHHQKSSPIDCCTVLVFSTLLFPLSYGTSSREETVQTPPCPSISILPLSLLSRSHPLSIKMWMNSATWKCELTQLFLGVNWYRQEENMEKLDRHGMDGDIGGSWPCAEAGPLGGPEA